MRPRTNPLALILRGTDDGDGFNDGGLIVVAHVDDPMAGGRRPGRHRDGGARLLVYAGATPDLTGIDLARTKLLIFDSREDE